jgi:FkbM family methyltransferase
MPSPGRLASVLLRRRVPLVIRAGLLQAEALRRARPRSAYALRYGPGRIFLSHDDYGVDWESLKFVAADHAYRTDYRGAVVLDLGAHKGYYGAHAFAYGARTVISYEPETANLEYLERSAATYRARGADWRVRRSAVGAERGEATLHVMGGSWGHALHPPDSWSKYEVGVQSVPVEAMGDILEEAESLTDERSRLVVKINVESEECAIVLETPAEAWSAVSELFVEMHTWAPCTAADLAEHLAPAGFRKLPSEMAPVLRLRREAAPGSGPRSAST